MSANTVETQWRGGPWPKGYSPNPTGRPKAALDVQALARQHTTAAIQTLVDCLQDPKLRVQAACALLDRGWGRPLQSIAAEDAATSNTLMHFLAAKTVAAISLVAPAPAIEGEVASSAPRSSGLTPANGTWPSVPNIFEPAAE